MRFGIDGITVVTGGNFTYFANLLPALAPMLAAGGDELFVYTRHGGRVTVPVTPAIIERRLVGHDTSTIRRGAWEQTALPWHARRDRLDAFFGPVDHIPLALACPAVCAFRNPNIYAPLMSLPPGERPRLVVLRALALASARRCRRGIFVSAASRDEIVPVLRLDPSKARVIHHGMGGFFRAALTGPSPWDRPYILMVSTLYEYKNSVRLIEAYDKAVRQRGLPHGLALVGAAVEAPEAAAIAATVARLGLQDHVRLPGEIRYPAVGAWYRHASAFVFPSWRETFGHPLLEAMAADLPIAASDIPVMREIGGDVAIYFDPFSVDALAAALTDVLDDAKREDRVQRGATRVAQFSWERTARQTLDTIREVAAGG